MAKKGIIEETESEVQNKYLIKFNKPHLFEGNEYTEIDLSDIEELTANKLKEADKIFMSNGMADPVKELNVSYCLIIASLITGKPLEFFGDLKANEAMKIKNIVSDFLFQ